MKFSVEELHLNVIYSPSDGARGWSVINTQYETPAREHYWSFEPDRQLASRDNVGISVYKITQDQGGGVPPKDT